MIQSHLNWFQRLVGWRRWAAAGGLGAVSVLAMPPFSLWPMLFFTFPGLVLLLDGAAEVTVGWRRSRAAAAIGWWFGFGYLVLGLYWIGGAFLVQADKFAILMPFAITGLPAYLACYYALATALAGLVWSKEPTRILALALAFAAGEWLRGHWFTGFPWNAVGYGLTQNDALAQSASLLGVTGLSLWAVLIFASPVLLISEPRRLRRWLWPGCALGLLLTGFLWGQWRLSQAEPANLAAVTVRLVQPNTPEAEKFEAASQRRIFDRMLDLSRRDATGKIDELAGTKLVIWPEEPLNFLLLQTPQALTEIGALLAGRATLITGAIRSEPDVRSTAHPPQMRFLNSLAVIDPAGKPGAIYDKIHLVPFGEYLPYESILNLFGLENLTRTAGGMAQGTNRRELKAAGIPDLSPLICYETIFPGETVDPGNRPAWLLNVTNDAWFGEQTGPYQHFHQARIRAIEEGLPLVRVAITGISAIVDARGRVLQQLPLLTAGVIDGVLPEPLPATLYARYGDGMLLAELLIGLALLALFMLRRRVRTAKST